MNGRHVSLCARSLSLSIQNASINADITMNLYEPNRMGKNNDYYFMWKTENSTKWKAMKWNCLTLNRTIIELTLSSHQRNHVEYHKRERASERNIQIYILNQIMRNNNITFRVLEFNFHNKTMQNKSTKFNVYILFYVILFAWWWHGKSGVVVLWEHFLFWHSPEK